jgi:hypothetical protein
MSAFPLEKGAEAEAAASSAWSIRADAALVKHKDKVLCFQQLSFAV